MLATVSLEMTGANVAADVCAADGAYVCAAVGDAVGTVVRAVVSAAVGAVVGTAGEADVKSKLLSVLTKRGYGTCGSCRVFDSSFFFFGAELGLPIACGLEGASYGR